VVTRRKGYSLLCEEGDRVVALEDDIVGSVASPKKGCSLPEEPTKVLRDRQKVVWEDPSSGTPPEEEI